jgi:hypothetical protein
VFASRGHGLIVNSGSIVARRLIAEMRISIRTPVFPRYLAAIGHKRSQPHGVGADRD